MVARTASISAHPHVRVALLLQEADANGFRIKLHPCASIACAANVRHDVWGDTVNIAARLETGSQPNRGAGVRGDCQRAGERLQLQWPAQDRQQGRPRAGDIFRKPSTVT
jgi:class 3 adenylate cyclase